MKRLYEFQRNAADCEASQRDKHLVYWCHASLTPNNLTSDNTALLLCLSQSANHQRETDSHNDKGGPLILTIDYQHSNRSYHGNHNTRIPSARTHTNPLEKHKEVNCLTTEIIVIKL